MERTATVAAGVITSITLFGLFLVLALLIPHPFPGVTEAMPRILLATMCVIVMVGAGVITWQNRKTVWFARFTVRLTTTIFVLAVLGTAASFVGLPGLITVTGAIAVLTFPVLVLALLNREALRRRGEVLVYSTDGTGDALTAGDVLAKSAEAFGNVTSYQTRVEEKPAPGSYCVSSWQETVWTDAPAWSYSFEKEGEPGEESYFINGALYVKPGPGQAWEQRDVSEARPILADRFISMLERIEEPVLRMDSIVTARGNLLIEGSVFLEEYADPV